MLGYTSFYITWQHHKEGYTELR